MARGQKYGDEKREKALAYRALGKSISETARLLEIPRSTVSGWFHEEKDEADEMEEVLEQMRLRHKKQFVRSAWETIEKAQELLDRRVTRALERDAEFDKLAAVIRDEDVLPEVRKAAVARLSELRCENISKLATVIGTLYDKQALAMREETEISSVAIKGFEEF